MLHTVAVSTERREEEPARRPVGRPRADGTLPTGNVREQIADAAAGLFIAKGYASTSTREIAAAVGLRQGSLAHYFGRKEHILAELLSRTVEPAIALVDGLGADLPPDVRFWILAENDCNNLCSGRHNLASLMLLPAARSETFSDFWAKREQLKQLYRNEIRAGVESGAFAAADPELATDASFAIVESLITWFDRGGRVSPVDAADYIARAALLQLLADPTRLDEVIDRAAAVTREDR
jgi:AcrR family transcriptional regulator